MQKTIALLTDIHLDEESSIHKIINVRQQWQKLLQDVVSRNVDEIMIAGDIGEAIAYPWFFQTLKETNIDTRLILGNHDSFADAMKYYKNDGQVTQNELYYSFEDEHYLYMFMDSSSFEISSDQYKWLSKNIVQDKKIILFIHHPVLPVDSEVDRLYPLKNREIIKEKLQSIPNEIVIFCGHYHTNDESFDKNITQYVTLATSFQIDKHTKNIELDISKFGYRLIHITKDGITTELIEHKQ